MIATYRPLDNRRIAVAVFVAAWTVLALLLVPRHYAAGVRDADPWPLLHAVVVSLADAYSWGAIALVAWWLAARLPLESGARARTLVIHAAAGVTMITVRIVAWIAFGRVVLGLPEPMSRASVLYYVPTYLLIYALLTGVGYALQYRQRLRDREVAGAQLQTQLTEARLQALRAQLQPHFLFNTLNAVSALVDEEPLQARRMLARLGELLRLTLELGDLQEVPLERELAWLERYVEIQHMRFGDRLRVVVRAAPAASGARVPCLVLQPLVENAIRYGVEARPDGGVVKVTAARVGDRLRLSVWDAGTGTAEPSATRGGAGIGLANTTRRLAALYGEAGELRLAALPGGATEAVVELPFRHESAASASASSPPPARGRVARAAHESGSPQ